MTNELRGFLQMLIGVCFLAGIALAIYFGRIPIGLSRYGRGFVASWASSPAWFVIGVLVYGVCAVWCIRRGLKTYRTPDRAHQVL